MGLNMCVYGEKMCVYGETYKIRLSHYFFRYLKVLDVKLTPCVFMREKMSLCLAMLGKLVSKSAYHTTFSDTLIGY